MLITKLVAQDRTCNVTGREGKIISPFPFEFLTETPVIKDR